MAERGDQSGTAAIVVPTDQLSVPDPNLAATSVEAWTGSNANPAEQQAGVMQAAASRLMATADVQKLYERMAPGSASDLNVSGTPSPEPAKVTSTGTGEMHKTLENVSRALVEGRNAAGYLSDELEVELVDFVKAHFEMSHEQVSKRYDHWQDAEIAHDVYVPVSVASDSANGRSNPNSRSSQIRRKRPRIIDVIKTPYSRAISDTRSTYFLSVFGGTPAFKIEPTGMKGSRRGARLVESVLSQNMRQIGFEANIHQMSLDQDRYGFAPVMTFWGEFGNHPFNLDPWSSFPDPRVTLQNRQEADFFAYRNTASRTALYRRAIYAPSQIEKLTHHNPALAWRCNMDLRETIRGQSVDLNDPTTVSTAKANEDKWTLGPAHVLNTIYVYFHPKQFNLNAPFRIYRIVVADEKHILLFDHSPFPHGEIPVVMGDANYDAHKTFNSGNYDLLMPLQRFQDWLLRSRVENVQSMIQSRLVVDPSKINITDILEPNALRLIRSLPGQNPKEGVYPLDVRDVTTGFWNDMQGVGELMQRASASNDTSQGIPTDVTRTATEIARLTSLGQQRLGTQARLTSAMTIRPWVRQMVSNLQYFGIGGGVVKAPKDAPDFNAQDGWYQWNLEEILGDYDYTIVDGTLPVDSTRNAENIIRAMRALSETGMLNRYNTDKFMEALIVSWGFNNIEEWKLAGAAPQMPAMPSPRSEVVPDEQIVDQLEKGNIIPMRTAVAEAGMQ